MVSQISGHKSGVYPKVLSGGMHVRESRYHRPRCVGFPPTLASPVHKVSPARSLIFVESDQRATMAAAAAADAHKIKGRQVALTALGHTEGGQCVTGVVPRADTLSTVSAEQRG
jgi:hypothetical protein